MGWKKYSILLLSWAVLGCGAEAAFPDPTPLENNPPPPTPVAETSIQFFSFGDWGTGTTDQTDVAAALSAFCALEACDFGLLLGDNFYDIGVASVTDPQWEDKFVNVYDAASLQLPFYAVLGNHDHDGNEQAQIDYTQIQGRWKMPAAQYTLRLPENSSTPLLELFAIDSVYGEALDSSESAALLDALNESQAHWKVLVAHHPLYSNGSHGDTVALRDSLLPLICEQVDAVLSGHDHLYSHLEDPNDGCRFHQWVIGTGGRNLYPVVQDPRALFSEAAFGFGAVTVRADSFQVRFFRADSSLADSFILMR